MTLTRFVTKSAFRNKRRSILSAILPAYHAAKLDIVEGLRYIG
ncbi:MAG: hypothetical protein ABR861_06845 [Terriglobales bacterium]|jgi:ABC-type lipoprotein release transport system permease subunit